MLLIRQTVDKIQKALRSKFDQRDFYAILGFTSGIKIQFDIFCVFL